MEVASFPSIEGRDVSLLSKVPGMNICIQTEATNFGFMSLEAQFVMSLRAELYLEAPVIFSLEKT